MDERYNVACNQLWTVPNAPLASAPGEELHPPILSMLEMYGGQVKIKDPVVTFFNLKLISNVTSFVDTVHSSCSNILV